jgi:hypothetical protein
MSALKVIPWGDVIEATPGLVKSARKVFSRSKDEPVPTPTSTPGTDSAAGRIAQLEASIAQLAEQQQASAQLVEKLAEQNARIVEAVDILRARTRLLMVACGVLAVLLAAAVAWGIHR